MASVADGDFREKLGCRSFDADDEVLESDFLQTEDGDDSVDLVKDLAFVPGGSAFLVEDSKVSSAVLRAPSSMRGGFEGPRATHDRDVPRAVQLSLLPVLEEVMNVEGAQGGLGDMEDGVSALLPAAMVSGPYLPSVAAALFVHSSIVVCSSMVGDFVVVEEELAASTVGRQQALMRRAGEGSPEGVAASQFAPLSKLVEASEEDEGGDRGESDREGHRTATRCVDAGMDASKVEGDGRVSERGGKMKGRGRGGWRGGGSTRGRGGRSRGRGPS
ncbi:hypothetical protein Dimus_013507 [Dionaea muscipula]